MSAQSLQFLADEGRDLAVVRALRAAGPDVLAMGEMMDRSDDGELIEQAHREQRILLSEDKDVGWLVRVSHADSSGVILIRFPGNARRALAEAVTRVVEEQGDRLLNAFVVVQPGLVRISYGPAIANRESGCATRGTAQHPGLCAQRKAEPPVSQGRGFSFVQLARHRANSVLTAIRAQKGKRLL